MRLVPLLSVILVLSVPTEASFEQVYNLVRNAVFGTVHLPPEILAHTLRSFRGFPVVGTVAQEGADLSHGAGSLAMNILKGSNRLLLPAVKGVHAVIEIPCKWFEVFLFSLRPRGVRRRFRLDMDVALMSSSESSQDDHAYAA